MTTLRLMSASCIMALASACAPTISRTNWMKSLQDSLPNALCAEGEFFRQCYTTTAIECGVNVALATSACLEEQRAAIPAVLRLPADDQKWGTTVGQCVGQRAALAVAAQKRDDPVCNDSTKWAR